MRLPVAFSLLMLAVPLMGSDCSVAARVGGPPPPPPEGSDPPPGQGGGGGVIIVTSGASSGSSRAAAEAVQLDRAIVASALAASAWIPPEFGNIAERPRIVDPRWATIGEPILSGEPNNAPMLWADEQASAVAAPIPEPTGSLLFACGLGLAAEVLRRHRARG